MESTLRQIILDTETTGLNTSDDHRIIEIGCVELIDRKLTGRVYHQYIKPEREIDAEAIQVHGITTGALKSEPLFRDVADDFLAFVDGSEIIAHNAPFDTGFINHELAKTGSKKQIEDYCSVTDTLKMAKKLHPGQRNSLDALSKRYGVDSSQRTLHGALLDCEILAEVFLGMTGGQGDLSLESKEDKPGANEVKLIATKKPKRTLMVIKASSKEIKAHDEMCSTLNLSFIVQAAVKKEQSALTKM